MSQNMQNGGSSIGIARTDHASRYLQQLAKHFAHRVPVTFTPEICDATFDLGTCHIEADAEQLVVTVASPDPAEIPRLQKVVEHHLVRFSFREPDMTLEWRAA